MKKVLLTGASGFVGSNVLPFLEKEYRMYTPTRKELDVKRKDEVTGYLRDNEFDVVIHFASPSPVRSAQFDSYDRLFADSITIFKNFYQNRDLFGKMIYSGSGAEYDKRYDITNVKEEQIGQTVPMDDYGLSKYIINDLASKSNNIYNLRIFACYGPREYDTKFIRHCIRCSLKNEPITIRQNCYFDYLYVDDYARYLKYFIENTPLHHDYNAVSGKRISLKQIAEIVCEKMGNLHPVQIMQEGLNSEYTACGDRIKKETGITELISIEEGIEKMIEWEKANEKTSG